MVFEKVAEMLANHLSIEQDSIKMETTFEELGVDSLDTVEMVMDLEESLGIELELEKKVAAEIIDSYGEVTVNALEEDPTVCLVEFGFAVAHGLNQIYLTVHMTV